MTLKHPMIRWAVPVAAVAVVAGAALAPRAMAEPTLPPKTAQQLLVDLQNQQVDAFSGTVETRTDLGLPALPLGDSDFAALTSGTHTVKVWHNGAEKSRVSLIDSGAEASVIRNGNDVWQWSSSSRTATHAVLTEHENQPGDATPPASTPQTPQQAAEQLLAKVEPTTEVTVTRTARIAGRSAYQLELDPKSTATLVDRITIAVDAENHAPLQVEVWASGANAPAIKVGYTSVSFTAPDDAVFVFTPPAGVTVEEATADHGDKTKPTAEEAKRPETTTVGEGWDAVTITRLPERPAGSEPTPDPGQSGEWEQVQQNLPVVTGPWGSGRVLTSALVTFVITDDGRVAVGMVPTDRVVAAIPQ